MNLKIKNKILLLAFEIIGKKPRQRSEKEKLWLKLHGGALPYYCEDYSLIKLI